jgi:hypothetical protein
MPAVICLLYLSIHAALYFAILRDRGGLDSERAIFLYHFASATILIGAFGIWVLASSNSDKWTWFVCVLMLHGIYSLSFLELWALADDSYSLAIMQIIGRGSSAAGLERMQELEAVGVRKRAARLHTLLAIGLVREGCHGSLTLTAAGRAAVAFGRSVLFLVNVFDHG